MNKEELRNKYIEKYSDTGYSHVKQEDKDLELKVHDLLVDIVINDDSRERLCDLFKDDYITRATIREIVDNQNLFLDFESTFIHHDILDDGEVHVLYDMINDRWFLNRSYDFLDHADLICKTTNLDINNVEVASIDGWRRTYWKNRNGDTRVTLGLEDLVSILNCVKGGNFSDLRKNIPLNNLNKVFKEYCNE